MVQGPVERSDLDTSDPELRICVAGTQEWFPLSEIDHQPSPIAVAKPATEKLPQTRMERLIAGGYDPDGDAPESFEPTKGDLSRKELRSESGYQIPRAMVAAAMWLVLLFVVIGEVALLSRDALAEDFGVAIYLAFSGLMAIVLHSIAGAVFDIADALLEQRKKR